MTTQETKKVTKIADKIASKRKAEEQGNWSRLSQDLSEVYKQPVSLREERVWQPSKHRSWFCHLEQLMSLDPLFSEIPTEALNSTMDKVEAAYNAEETRIYDALVRKNIDELLGDKKSKIFYCGCCMSVLRICAQVWVDGLECRLVNKLSFNLIRLPLFRALSL